MKSFFSNEVVEYVLETVHKIKYQKKVGHQILLDAVCLVEVFHHTYQETTF